MNQALKSVRNWFGYTRKERRASVVLLVIIVFVFLIRYTVPGQKVSIEEITLTGELTGIPEGDVSETRSAVVKTVHPQREHRKQIPVLDLNSCDSSDLELLPGIGPVLASRIVRYRNLLGGYASPLQLREVYGLPEETFTAISQYIYADSGDVSRININTAGFRELIRLPYFDRPVVNGILKYRELSGPVEGIEELVDNNIIPGDKALKAVPYLDFSVR